MKLQQTQSPPHIVIKPFIYISRQFTPISALLSVIGVVFPFMVPPTNPFPFLLLLSPLYINIHNYILGLCLISAAIVWPWTSGQIDLAVRVITVINSVYIISSSNRKQKYKIVPSQIKNQQVPIIL